MELFDQSPAAKAVAASAPLATRMRPRTLDEFVGQRHLVGPGRVLRRAIERDELSSLILYGPPGTGKTTLAHIIAAATKSVVEQVNAVTAGVADLKAVITRAQDRRRFHGRRTILFIDEIHRFNKAQQDVLLPHVEEGTLVLVGATTENPFFEVNATLVSRSRVYRLEPLTDEDIRTIVAQTLANPERGLGSTQITIDEDALAHLVAVSSGDARIALNTLDLAALAAAEEGGIHRITRQMIEDVTQRRALTYDREGDAHYDHISAFIKSMRGSDPDAAVYWLMRMLEAGEDPRFIARRMVIHAAEDVGLADPMALVVAVAAAHSVEFVGLPEAQIPMTEAAIYIATAPKSNAVVRAIGEARSDVMEQRADPVPLHLRSTGHPQAQRRLGYGRDYVYTQDAPGAFAPQQYVPDNVKDRIYYEPSDRGFEAEIRRRLREWWKGLKRYAGS